MSVTCQVSIWNSSSECAALMVSVYLEAMGPLEVFNSILLGLCESTLGTTYGDLEQAAFGRRQDRRSE